jgi:hypothetical protein
MLSDRSFCKKNTEQSVNQSMQEKYGAVSQSINHLPDQSIASLINQPTNQSTIKTNNKGEVTMSILTRPTAIGIHENRSEGQKISLSKPLS